MSCWLHVAHMLDAYRVGCMYEQHVHDVCHVVNRIPRLPVFASDAFLAQIRSRVPLRAIERPIQDDTAVVVDFSSELHWKLKKKKRNSEQRVQQMNADGEEGGGMTWHRVLHDAGGCTSACRRTTMTCAISSMYLQVSLISPALPRV